MPKERFILPNSIGAIVPPVGQIQGEMEAHRERGGIPQVYLFHNRPRVRRDLCTASGWCRWTMRTGHPRDTNASPRKLIPATPALVLASSMTASAHWMSAWDH